MVAEGLTVLLQDDASSVRYRSFVQPRRQRCMAERASVLLEHDSAD